MGLSLGKNNLFNESKNNQSFK